MALRDLPAVQNLVARVKTSSVGTHIQWPNAVFPYAANAPMKLQTPSVTPFPALPVFHTFPIEQPWPGRTTPIGINPPAPQPAVPNVQPILVQPGTQQPRTFPTILPRKFFPVPQPMPSQPMATVQHPFETGTNYGIEYPTGFRTIGYRR